MKNIKFVVLLLCLAFVFNSCKSGQSVELPFSIDYEKDTMPYFEVPLCDTNGIRFSDSTARFGIDTACPHSFLYKSGVEYLFETVDDYYLWCKNNNYDIEDEHIGIIVKSICLDFDVASVNPVFVCDEKAENELYEGIIGYDVLKKTSLLTFDFKRNELVIGGEKLKKKKLPLKMLEFKDEKNCEEYLSIPVEIDGKEYDVLLDTGACSQGVPTLAISGKCELTDEVSVKIDSEVFENVKVFALEDCNFDDKNLETHHESFFGDAIILGNAFFQNHRIQLDFENMTFAMD